MNLEFIVNHTVHHLLGDLESTNSWRSVQTSRCLFGFVEKLNDIGSTSSAFEILSLKALFLITSTSISGFSIYAIFLVDIIIVHSKVVTLSTVLWSIIKTSYFHNDLVIIVSLIQESIQRFNTQEGDIFSSSTSKWWRIKCYLWLRLWSWWCWLRRSWLGWSYFTIFFVSS